MKYRDFAATNSVRCAECGGPAMPYPGLEEAKKDACYYKVRSRYKVWPSAYASGALVQCRKKGASNWGNKSKNESLAKAADAVDEQSHLEKLTDGQEDVLGISDPSGKFHPMNIQMLVGAFLRTHRMTDSQELQENLPKHIGLWLVQHRQDLEKMGYQVQDYRRIMALMQEVMDVDAVFEGENLEENLRKWFREKWVRFGPDGKIRGDCARGSDSEGKPKCLPQSKAHRLGRKGRASAAARKRRQDPNPDRSGRAINVNTKKNSNEGVAEDSGALDPRPTMAPRKIEFILTLDGHEAAVYDRIEDAIRDARRFAMQHPQYDIVIKRDVCTRTNLMRVQEGQSLGILP